MEFEWDDGKSARNLIERGFDFAFAQRLFDDEHIVVPDERRDYGEKWYRAIGQIEGKIYTVVYTDRADARRIIFARRANGREALAYLA